MMKRNSRGAIGFLLPVHCLSVAARGLGFIGVLYGVAKYC